jgi:23S rRNA (adenine2503-C2)-methyltransferase
MVAVVVGNTRRDLVEAAYTLGVSDRTLVTRVLLPNAAPIAPAELVASAEAYARLGGYPIQYQWALLAGVNDGPDPARRLADVSRRMRSNVNLICYNPVECLPYERPTDEASQRFLAVLRERGINAHLRRSRGRDIDGACGQLRRRDRATPYL